MMIGDVRGRGGGMGDGGWGGKLVGRTVNKYYRADVMFNSFPLKFFTAHCVEFCVEVRQWDQTDRQGLTLSAWMETKTKAQ